MNPETMLQVLILLLFSSCLISFGIEYFLGITQKYYLFMLNTRCVYSLLIAKVDNLTYPLEHFKFKPLMYDVQANWTTAKSKK